MNLSKSKRILLDVVCLTVLVGALAWRGSLLRAENTEDGSNSSLRWIPWSQEVVAQAQKADKLILIDVYADWCGPCKIMDQITYRDPAVLKKLEDFITVKINSDTDQEAAGRFTTGALPTTAILAADGQPILAESGYLSPRRFLALLNDVAKVLADLQRLKKEVEVNPEDPIMTAALGELYMKMGRPADASRWLERALARKGGLSRTSRASAMFNLGLAHLITESFEKGITQLVIFQQEFPNYTRTVQAAYFVELGKFLWAGAKVEKSDYEGAGKLYRYLVKQSKDEQLVSDAQKELSLLKYYGQPAPELDVSKWINGQPITLQRLIGKVVLLDIFQIICPGCQAARPQIMEFRKRYRKKGLEVLGIAVAFEYENDQRPDHIKQYVKEERFSYPVAIDRDMTATFRKYQAGGTPWTVLIDRAGKVRHMGFFRGPEIEAKIQTLLAERSNKKR